MEITDRYEVVESLNKAGAPPRAFLRDKNNPYDRTQVNGVELEAQLDCDGKTLVFLTEDCPFEEALHITLLGTNSEVLDEVEISSLYSTGVFKDLKMEHPDTCIFSFFESIEFKLSVKKSPIRKLWANSKFVNRPKKLFPEIYLIIDAI